MKESQTQIKFNEKELSSVSDSNEKTSEKSIELVVKSTDDEERRKQ